MTTPSLEADTARRLRALEDALYNLQRERSDVGSTLDNCPTGTVVGFLSSTPPQGWLPLDGSITVTAAAYPSLHAYLTANGLSTTLPDYRNRFVVGAGSTYTSTSTGGSADAPVVAHSHDLPAKYTNTAGHTHSGVGGGVAENSNPTDGPAAPTITTASSGASGTNANLPPYRGLYWMIRS